jgi:hypothetical protein
MPPLLPGALFRQLCRERDHTRLEAVLQFNLKGRFPVPSFLENQFERNAITTSVDHVFNWARQSSLWPLTFGLACCAIEMIASSTSRFDIARFGAEVFRPSPQQRGRSIQYLCRAAGRG